MRFPTNLIYSYQNDVRSNFNTFLDKIDFQMLKIIWLYPNNQYLYYKLGSKWQDIVVIKILLNYTVNNDDTVANRKLYFMSNWSRRNLANVDPFIIFFIHAFVDITIW